MVWLNETRPSVANNEAYKTSLENEWDQFSPNVQTQAQRNPIVSFRAFHGDFPNIRQHLNQNDLQSRLV